ncbi:cupin domain-containing protein [Actomonas aquatica]|uniref:Cupin domain-containing protein n=1 Tax=Actomonas aquatica TaxID=2866162 RepID=A0ABZ1C335_9BACT|nr:cupin domain-containing protein [Opitutus sp. WL0086]WRQ85613.1 cupin domain-containing protein [Opitutus sp. WL0086]
MKIMLRSVVGLVVGLLVLPLVGQSATDGEGVEVSAPVTVVRSADVAWREIERAEFPPGLAIKSLHANARIEGGVATLRFAKGFVEPRHFHTTAGHSIYVLKGRIDYDGEILTAGDFIYTPTDVVHGGVALEETELLLWTDGPLDFHLAETAETETAASAEAPAPTAKSTPTTAEP